jgi:hypothetical protein
LPQTENGIRGSWNADSVRTLIAVFELQRLELHSEVEDQHIDHGLLARVIHELATRSYFTDHRSPSLLIDQELHLRLLAGAIRLYKYNGRSLDHQVHQDLYQGLSRLARMLEDNRKSTDERLKVEESNVDFFLKHCEYLLLSIDNTESLGHSIARRAVLTMDTAGGAEHHPHLELWSLEVIQRQRTRPKWHNEYLHLEDACWAVFASDLRTRGSSNINALLEEAITATSLLRNSLEAHLPQKQQPQSKVNKVLKRAVSGFANGVPDASQGEEHIEYMHYGILDLLYRLSFRCRKRSRIKCFAEYVRIIKIILERCPATAGLRTKATDLWNRLLDLGEKDGIGYGEEEDRQAVHGWTSQHPDETEALEYSASSFTF